MRLLPVAVALFLPSLLVAQAPATPAAPAPRVIGPAPAARPAPTPAVDRGGARADGSAAPVRALVVRGAGERGADPFLPYMAWQVDEPARRVDSAGPPPYPAALRGTRARGPVVVHFTVSAEGVPDTTTLRPLLTIGREFTDAVRAQLPRLRYAPARKGGQAVAQVVEERFVFEP
ncbi:MAG TPA: energy transducer TonB [Gemmatimonadaceae bacterium]|nr:energy transducer TonB [Gemmatimonadaceae bacterium]